MENAAEWLAINGSKDDVPGCYRTPDKKGPCVAPGPSLSQRAEDVWGVFGESMTTVVGMGIGMAPNRSSACVLLSECGISFTAEHWFLFGDLERAWVNKMNEKKPDE